MVSDLNYQFITLQVGDIYFLKLNKLNVIIDKKDKFNLILFFYS